MIKSCEDDLVVSFQCPEAAKDSIIYSYKHSFSGVVAKLLALVGANIDPSTWEDKKNPGESLFPAQVSKIKKEMKKMMKTLTLLEKIFGL
ncbi:hypothetical protein BC332_27835 [Capsicum chinense]|nr:hypothetical protein BC332_27835 [Capsicum chinense]